MTRAPRRTDNAEVARTLREVADLLEVQDGNAFRVRAYRGAARTVEELPGPVAGMIGNGAARLTNLPGIGDDLAGKIRQIVRTGTLPLMRELEAAVPRGAVALMRIRGIGPHRARLLAERLHVSSVAGLERAARAGRIRRLRGFGHKTENAILRELTARRVDEHRVRRATAAVEGDDLVEYLSETGSADRVMLAGSMRRCRETVGDLDVLATSRRRADIVRRFVAYPGATEVLAQGTTRASVRLRSGLLVDLRVVAPASFGAALHYFTGSKAHSIAIRRLGQDRGLKVNEYGVFRRGKRIAGRSEEEVFKSVGLPWIPPELREDRGEIEAARAGRLPRLVELEHIRGDLQSHTTDSDGRDTLDAMARAAEAMGYEYLAVTDHTPAVRVATGLDAAGFRRQWKRIDRLNARLGRLTILKGVEADILEDGLLDLDDRVLAGFDVVLVAIHSHFELSPVAQTARIIRAIEHSGVHILAHPTGRLIGRRQSVTLDLDAVCRAAADHGVWLEVNAQPERLDLDDIACRRAIELGVRIVIDTDAHSTAELLHMRWGVDQARRGWAQAADVMNTKSLAQFRRALR
jgi:DNA polymerase (family 10)